MAGIRRTMAAQLDTDMAKLAADLASYFSLQQSGVDVDLRSLVVVWLSAKLAAIDEPMAAALRYQRNLEDFRAVDKTLVQLDPLAGA